MIESISTSAISVIVLEALVGILLPIILLILWVRYAHVKIKPFFIGVGVFVLFAMLLEQALHAVCIVLDNPISRTLNANPWLYSIYGGLSAGVFEETGRLVAYRHWMKQEKHPDNAITYGLGHGGIECIYILGVSMIAYLVIALRYNALGYEQFMLKMGSDLQTEWSSVVLSIDQLDMAGAGAAILERVCALALQVELSVIVFASVRENKKSLFALAILLHAMIDVIAGLSQTGIVTSVWILEGIVAIYVGAIFFFADKKYESLKKSL